MFEKYKMIDLTHPLNSKIPTWDGKKGFQMKERDQVHLFTHSGTHIDAPSYFGQKGDSIDRISLKQLLVPACVLDLSNKATSTYEVAVDDILQYETTHGRIPKNSLVIAYTGWSLHWPNKKSYRNADKKGKACFPTFGLNALKLLLKRKIAGVAIDTLALESLTSTFPGHKLLFSKNKYIIENIANVDKLPPKGAFVIALPLKIEKGYEAPARVIGLIARSST